MNTFKDVQHHVKSISAKLDKLWHISTDNIFSLFLDDLLTTFGFNGGKHYRAITEEERKHLFDLGQLYAQSVINHPWVDILGSVYMDLAGRGHKKCLGQYFTPSHVCQLMAKMSNHDLIHGDNESVKVLRVAEPTCGSGAMILGLLNVCNEENPDLIEKLDFTMVDLDMTCVKMSTVQVLSNMMIHQKEIAGLHVYRGNALGPASEFETFCSFRNWKDEDITIEQLKTAQPINTITAQSNDTSWLNWAV